MIVIAKLKVQAGKEADLEKVVLDILPKVKDEAGTLVYNFHRSKKDPSVYVFYERYVDQDALNLHSGTPHFKAMSKALGSLLAAAPEIELYEELGNIQ
ncbi:MAG: putative quinol monooxygenase [bacterium]